LEFRTERLEEAQMPGFLDRERRASKRRKCLLRHYNIPAFRKLPVVGGGPVTLFTF
jgi:hypothetical protein